MREYQVNYDICRRDYLFNDMDNYIHDNSLRVVCVVIYVLKLVFVAHVL